MAPSHCQPAPLAVLLLLLLLSAASGAWASNATQASARLAPSSCHWPPRRSQACYWDYLRHFVWHRTSKLPGSLLARGQPCHAACSRFRYYATHCRPPIGA